MSENLKEEALYYNAINVLNGGDYKKSAELKKRFSTWKKSWLESPGKNKIDPETEQKKLDKARCRLILFESPEYPKILREISWPPMGIYILGNDINDEFPSLAIVGTRKATENGKELARKFSYKIASAGLKIVSGLALGVDAEAHQGCLEAKGKTIAVMGNGLDNFYPRHNENLAHKILENRGAIISEYPIGMPPLPHHFLERNRIVSGLSSGTLVIEAPKESGSLATARFAIEQNRDVFVIPGPIRHPNYVGSHQLIRQGAELVTSPEEILESLKLESQKQGNLNLQSNEEKAIVDILKNSSDPLEIDKIIEMTNLEPHIANQTVGLLIIKEIVKETIGGYSLK